MKTDNRFLIAALILLTLFFTDSFALADFSGKTTEITTSITGHVSGNSGGNEATILSDFNVVPDSTNPANVEYNTAIIKNNANVSRQAFGGITLGLGNVTNNTLIINSGSSVNGLVSGGWVDNPDSSGVVTNNKVTISGVANNYVYGGLTYGTGEVTGNIVTISGDVYGTHIYGGNISNPDSSATISNNIVSIENGATAHNLYGAYTSGKGFATMNKVIINGSVKGISAGVNVNVYGGRSALGAATANEISIGGEVGDLTSTANVYGGYGLIASDNRINVYLGGIVTGSVIGGDSPNGDVTGNTVEISGTVVSSNLATSNVFGGRGANNGIVTGNIVTVNSGGVVGNVAGGRSTGTSIAVTNKVIISAGGIATGDVYGASGSSASSGNLTGNAVNIDGNANSNAFGGYTLGLGAVTGNSVTIGGTVDSQVTGGYVNNTSNTATVSDNIVTITGIVGAAPGQGDVYGGRTSGSGAVNNNTVTISGTVYNTVYGGFTDGIGPVNFNTVTIEGTAILTTASLWGSNISGVAGTGNTLNVNGFFGEIDTMGNFENYNFMLGQLGGLDGLTYIKINGVPVDIDDTNISISFASAFVNNVLNSGDVITVISDITTITGPNAITVTPLPFIAYDYTVTYGTALLLTINSMALQPETEALAEGFAAGLAFLEQAADVRSSIYFAAQGPRFIPFAKMIYGKQHINTGSSVNVKGFSAIAGLALNTNFDNGSQLVVGAFVEGGWGDYDSRNSFRNSASIKGSGDTEYYGGGVLARYAMKSGLYGEGTFAAGKTETDFRTYDFAPGTRSKYDYSVPYYSAHLAVGKIFNMCDIFSLDLYGKYLWTRQAGDNVTVDGYRFKFKDADSHRVRVGGNLQATGMPQLQPYVGAAYEYEFSGKIKGSLSGMNLDKPSLRGGTGIGELGLVWSPTESGNFKVDLGAQGYVGKREGVSGGLTVTMPF